MINLSKRKKIVSWQVDVLEALPIALRRPILSARLLPAYLSWYRSDDGRKRAVEILSSMRDRFQGCRCVVIGNGPSLNRMNLARLRDEFTFGLNRIYLLFSELGFATTFLVAVNRFVIEQFGGEIIDSASFKVLHWGHCRQLHWSADAVGLMPRPFGRMDGDVTRGYFMAGGTVTNVALELAFFLGFSEVILIGVDHAYSIRGKAGKPIRSEDGDPDHFSTEYFGRGVIWQLPDYRRMEAGYRRVKALFEGDSRLVVDATLGGELKVFDKVSLDEALSTSTTMTKLEWVRNFGAPLATD